MDACFNGDFLLDHLSAGCSLGLISNEKYAVSQVFKTMFQVVGNSSAGAHATAGDDDGWAIDMHQFLMVLIFFRRGLGCMGADDLAAKPGINQLRHPTDVINMGVGQEQIVYFVGWHGKLGKVQHRVVAGGGTAVDQGINAIPFH